MERIRSLGVTPDKVRLYPDPAGNARSTKGLNRSDIQILRESGFPNILFHRSIKSVRDCVNAVNALFDQDAVLIHPRCKQLIADLEQIKWRDSGFEFDKSNSKRSHWLDGFKDMVNFEYPCVKPLQLKESYRR